MEQLSRRSNRELSRVRVVQRGGVRQQAAGRDDHHAAQARRQGVLLRGKRFGHRREPTEIVDEIALNRSTFAKHRPRDLDPGARDGASLTASLRQAEP